ncbi:hypothetical protein H4C81_22470 [Pseudomonas monteilii]|uniref:hypothetical protein n=1 Tax=Pseudomonas monteilii TaxID=76759 RepID=UPI0015FA80B7|nr:hypothetical protein [Pseudomonas monteilii]MBA6091613.1 hypothetical protein [Pseudomonas monteilii]
MSDTMTDGFRGDNKALIECINALLALDAKGALMPCGIGGHARSLLEASAARLSSAEARPPITIERVLRAYQYATMHPHRYLRGTTNWCAAVAESLNGQVAELAGGSL